MLWAYSANKQRGGGKNQQSMAEAVAEHFKRVSQKVTIACFALRLLRRFAPPWPFFSSCSIKLEDADRRTTRACSETHASADFHGVVRCWGWLSPTRAQMRAQKDRTPAGLHHREVATGLIRTYP